MKKILLLFSAVGMLSLTGCNNDDYDEDTIAEVFETPALTFTESGNYQIVVDFDNAIPASNMVLVYRLTDDPDTDLDVWELIPRTLYFDNGDEVDYDYNFTQNDILLYMGSNSNLANYSSYTQNQIFRVVIIPGYGSNFKTSANSMEQFKDYDAVIKRYGIDDSKI